jgi:hypothetical protein
MGEKTENPQPKGMSVMKSDKPSPGSEEGSTGILEGTSRMGYWEFRKIVCANHGWQLRRTAPQTYDVLNDKNEKIGTFQSQKGYCPARKPGKR